MARAYYNEIDPYAAQWLRNLIAAALLPEGDVDERSVADVEPADIAGYGQCHFFAGIGGWALAARLAGWPDDRPLWTGSCPCQPFSNAGRRGGFADERHLWPEWFRLIRAVRPPVVVGEQVAAAAGVGWLDRVFSDLEREGYAGRAAVLPACAVDAPHRRDRLWFVADTALREQRRPRQPGEGPGRSELPSGGHCSVGAPLAYPNGDGWLAPSVGRANAERDVEPCGLVGDAASDGWREGRSEHEVRSGRPATSGSSRAGGAVGDADGAGSPLREQQQQPGTAEHGLGPRAAARERGSASFWSGAEWIRAADGKSRRVKPGVRLLAHGVPARVAKLRAFGNAIVPEVAAEVLAAYLETFG